jgi:hypothetical protein
MIRQWLSWTRLKEQREQEKLRGHERNLTDAEMAR